MFPIDVVLLSIVRCRAKFNWTYRSFHHNQTLVIKLYRASVFSSQDYSFTYCIVISKMECLKENKDILFKTAFRIYICPSQWDANCTYPFSVQSNLN